MAKGLETLFVIIQRGSVYISSQFPYILLLPGFPKFCFETLRAMLVGKYIGHQVTNKNWIKRACSAKL